MSRGPDVCLIRFSSIGDIVLTTAFLRQVHTQLPGARVVYITKREFADLLRYNPYVDHLIVYDSDSGLRGLNQLADDLKDTTFDFIFDLHNNQRSHYLTHRLKYRKIRRIHKSRLTRALLVYTKLNLYRSTPSIPERYLKTGHDAGIKDDGLGLELYWPPETEQTLASRLLDEAPLLALAPGAGFYTKMWPLDYWKKLIPDLLEHHPHHLALIGGKNETERFNELVLDDRVINLAGQLPLLQSAALIQRSAALICNDSGVMHMAAAVQTPMVAIFGSTTRHLGFFPFRARVEIVENNHQWCRPCSHVGRASCPLDHFNCMRALTPDHVHRALNRLLGA
ncbi:MAG: glycosyltransferase family 9 protein [Calditrichaeota bacterium]|nr:MAG: glycosyltransferase family 9 protein [Calditrichota bacterium]